MACLLTLAAGAAQGFSVNINFQTNGPTVSPGYLADTGLLYGDRGNGFIYGWLADNTSGMQDISGTNTVDFRYATCAMIYSNNVWQIAVPNGAYMVHVVAGSVSRLSGVYRLDVQGSLAVQGTPEGSNYWVEGTINIKVTNSVLTVSNADGFFNTRLAFLEIRSAGNPTLEAFPATTNQPFTVSLVNPSGGLHWIEASSNLVNWTRIGALTNTPGQLLSLTDATAASRNRRFYRARVPFPLPPQVVYSNDFESGVGPEWSTTSLDVTPSGRIFLGSFTKKTVKLNLTNLPAHATITLAFDFYSIQSWDGNSPVGGPDIFNVNVTGGPTLLNATFRNLKSAGPGQTYPGLIPANVFASRTGATEKSTLGYTEILSAYGDSVYHLSYTFEHSASSVELNFWGNGSVSGSPDESWGLDNVVVSVRDFY
ncbi:MAG: hypothetical protein WCO56_12280 [Verrucomicrobiota bacterium]